MPRPKPILTIEKGDLKVSIYDERLLDEARRILQIILQEKTLKLLENVVAEAISKPPEGISVEGKLDIDWEKEKEKIYKMIEERLSKKKGEKDG